MTVLAFFVTVLNCVPGPVGAVGRRRLGGAARVELGAAAEAGAAALDAARGAGRRSRAGRGAGPERKSGSSRHLGWWLGFLVMLPEFQSHHSQDFPLMAKSVPYECYFGKVTIIRLLTKDLKRL